MSRQSVVSGQYFTGSPVELARNIGVMCGGERSAGDLIPDVFGVMVPHASFDFCGRVAAGLWSQVGVPDRVIVVGPNHTGLGAAAAIASAVPFATPIGDVAVDRELCDILVDSCPLMTVDDEAHEEEHSIEAVLPFVQVLNPAVRVVPICVRMLSYTDCRLVADAIAGAVRAATAGGGTVLLVASSDLNHGDPVRVGMRRDRMVLDRIEALDPAGLYAAVVEHHISMCGMIPVVIMMLAAQQLGAGFAETLAYGTSMDQTGDPSSVVGYAAVALRSRCPIDRIRNLKTNSRETGGIDVQG